MHCGTECSCGCMGKGGGDYFEWMFLGKERRRNPGGGGQCGRDHSKLKDTSFSMCINLFPICFKEIAPIWTSPQSESGVPPALATSHQPLQAMADIHPSVNVRSWSFSPPICLCLSNDSPPPFFVIQNALSTKILGQLRKNNIVYSLKMF